MQNSSKFTSCSGQICIKAAFLTFVIAHDKANNIALGLNLRYEPKKSPKVIVIDIGIDRVIKPAVQNTFKPCRSRKYIQGHIPMHDIYLYFYTCPI